MFVFLLLKTVWVFWRSDTAAEKDEGVPLSSSSRQGAMAGGTLRLPPCPKRLPLLFPKSSSILFGSPINACHLPPGGEGKGRAKALVFRCACAQDFSTRSLSTFVPSVEMTRVVFLFRDPFDSLRSLRVTGADAPHPSFVPNDTFPLGGRQGWGGYPRARRAGLSATLCRFINTRKRQNHAFAFFTLQRGAARGKSEGGARL